MSDQSDGDVHFPDPPEGLITYPTNQVRALMDDPDQLVAAVEDLVQAGFENISRLEGSWSWCQPTTTTRLPLRESSKSTVVTG